MRIPATRRYAIGALRLATVMADRVLGCRAAWLEGLDCSTEWKNTKGMVNRAVIPRPAHEHRPNPERPTGGEVDWASEDGSSYILLHINR